MRHPSALARRRRCSDAQFSHELTVRRATAEGIKAEMRAAAGPEEEEEAPMEEDSDEELAE